MALEIDGRKSLANYLNKLVNKKNTPCSHLKVLPEDLLCLQSGNKYTKGMLVCSKTAGRQTGKDDVSLCTLTITEFLEDGMLAKCEGGYDIKVKMINETMIDLINP